MRKVCALLLAILLMASAGCTWAEESAEETAVITFQDIPWETSVEAVRLWLLENNVCSADVHTWLSNNDILPVDALRLSGDAVQLWHLGYVLQDSGKMVGIQDNESFQYIQFDGLELNPEYMIWGKSPEILTFIFVCGSEETKLISVVASFDINWSEFEAMYHEFEALYGADESGRSLLMRDLTSFWEYKKAGDQDTAFSHRNSTSRWGKTNIEIPSDE